MHISNLFVPLCLLICSTSASSHNSGRMVSSRRSVVSHTHMRSVDGKVHTEEHLSEERIHGSHRMKIREDVKDGEGKKTIESCDGEECHSKVEEIHADHRSPALTHGGEGHKKLVHPVYP